MKTFKYLHIFSDASYTQKYIEFIEKYFNLDEHIFIILVLNKDSKFINFYKSLPNNCIITNSKSIYFKYKQYFQISNKIIIHQLNKPILMASLLLFYPKSFKKMTWVIWGGDVYFYKYKTDSIKDNFIEFLRRKIIKRIPFIVSYIKGDYDKVVKIYKSNAKWIQAWYPSPIDIDLISNLSIESKQSDVVRIIVGNSADPSNEHINTFRLLKKFNKENIEVYTVLSYGGSKSYIDSVILEGNKIFGTKFKPIMQYMTFENYLNFLDKSDICILNHKRQQGLGNQLVFFILKKKVFISEATTPFKYYKDKGIDIYSTESIEKINFEDFIFQRESEKDKSRELILEDNDLKKLKNDWMKVFNGYR